VYGLIEVGKRAHRLPLVVALLLLGCGKVHELEVDAAPGGGGEDAGNGGGDGEDGGVDDPDAGGVRDAGPDPDPDADVPPRAPGVLLFGGEAGGGRLGDTWLWVGDEWFELSPDDAPSARRFHRTAFDSRRGRVVLFGGGTPGRQDDTWEWDGDTWIERSPQESPPARLGHAMAYDEQRERVVLFGGSAPDRLGDTWEWDGERWIDLTPSSPLASPSARAGHTLAYDRARELVLLFGGEDDLTIRDDLWAWDGERWERIDVESSPPERMDHAMAYDADRERIVVFGGAGLSATLHTDTWEWDGEAWTGATPADSPLGRIAPALTFDADRGHVMLFGGIRSGNDLRDQWVWDGEAGSWRELTPLGPPPSRNGHALSGTRLPR
jgi:hypothetical protein